MLTRRRFAVLIALSTTLQLAGAATSDTACETSAVPPTAQPATSVKAQTEAQKSFAQLVDEYFTASFKANPNWATDVGIHDYDTRMNTMMQSELNNRITELKEFKRRIESVDPKQLDKTARIDQRMLLSDANAQLLELESVRNWRRNPDMYSSKASAEIFSLMKRNFASPEERLRLVIAREKQIPDLLAHAKTNLTEPVKIYSEVALEQLPGIISFFETQVPAAFEKVDNAQLQKEFAETNAYTVWALKSYQDFIKNALLPKAKEEFAIGAENYRNKLLYEEMVNEPLDSLLARGMTELKRLQNAFIETAKQIDPNKDPHEVYASLSSDHPQPDNLIDSVTGVLSSLREQSKAVVTIPSEADLKVQETPPFMRAVTFASMDTPGPFEMLAKEAYYQVTLPEKDWNSKRVEEHMRFFCEKDLINTSVHEAYPGHYVQGLWMRQAPSKTRKLLYCGTNSEGWAHYCEEMMTDRAKGDPKLRLVQLHDALLRAARYVVGIRMHTQGMTMDQAREFFVKEGFQEPANADRETKRGTMDPTYLVYTLGKLQILALRDDYQKVKGSSFSLKNFHDSFLAQGCAPVSLVREVLLESDDTTH